MASCVQASMVHSSLGRGRRTRCKSINTTIRNSATIPMPPPFNPKDPFLQKLAAAAASSPTLKPFSNSDSPPYLDIFDSPQLMASPAQVERSSSSYSEHKPRRPPPDLPSLLLDGRIVYIAMPLVPVVTELVVAQLLYLQWTDPKAPIYLYINSTGTTRDDGETVGLESEGFAIYDALMQTKTEICTVNVGCAIGQACLLLAAGKKGRRFTLPHSKAMLQQPRVPSSGLLPASDVLIRAKEVKRNKDTLIKLLAKHTEHSIEEVSNAIKLPFHMDAQRAIEFGVVDKVLWRGQETLMAAVASPEDWDKGAGIKEA